MVPREYTPLAQFDDLPGRLPEGTLPENVDTTKVAGEAVKLLNSLQQSRLHSDVIWRDLLSFTGYFRTFVGPSDVANVFHKLSERKLRSEFRSKGAEPRIAKSGPRCSWLDVDVLFSTRHGELDASCMGTVSVIPDEQGQWRVWMLRTWLESFEGHGNPDVPRSNAHPEVISGTTNGDQQVKQFDAIVVGGGQAGLSTAGRMHALGIRYFLLERHKQIGDTWNKRYDSLRWHTSKDYGVLPFGPTFPVEDDYMLPAKRIGAGHKAWSEKYGINARTDSLVESARWNPTTETWTVRTSGENGTSTLTAKNLVLCIGPGHAKPIFPQWAAADQVKASGFKGTIVHAFDGYRSAEAWSGKRGLVRKI